MPNKTVELTEKEQNKEQLRQRMLKLLAPLPARYDNRVVKITYQDDVKDSHRKSDTNGLLQKSYRVFLKVLQNQRRRGK